MVAGRLCSAFWLNTIGWTEDINGKFFCYVFLFFIQIIFTDFFGRLLASKKIGGSWFLRTAFSIQKSYETNGRVID